MREFFHGWRRKIGVVTLVMACVLMVGWVRSPETCDLLCPAKWLWLASCRGGMIVVRCAPRHSFHVWYSALDATGLDEFGDENRPEQIQWLRLGFGGRVEVQHLNSEYGPLA